MAKKRTKTTPGLADMVREAAIDEAMSWHNDVVKAEAEAKQRYNSTIAALNNLGKQVQDAVAAVILPSGQRQQRVTGHDLVPATSLARVESIGGVDIIPGELNSLRLRLGGITVVPLDNGKLRVHIPACGRRGHQQSDGGYIDAARLMVRALLTMPDLRSAAAG